MTLLRVAKIAGVSPSTVSRVVNNHPRVSSETAMAVRKAMAQVNFTPRHARNAARRNGLGGNGKSIRNANILFMIFGTSGSQTVPAFEQLLRGVSAATSEHEADMAIQFVADPDDVPANLLTRRVDGLLLHGEKPGPELQARLESIPTVWLMANRQRPAWGDQVLPDNTVVGELAANYLLQRGHKHLAVCSVTWGAWAMDVRSMAFVRQAQAEGGQATVLHGPVGNATDLWRLDGVNLAATQLVDRFMELSPRPTGLFIVEDRQAMPIYAALRSRGLSIGASSGANSGAGSGDGGGDVDIISCNNERPHLLGLDPVPATIDIRVETIGRRAVEQLVWRMNSRDRAERVRTMIEPVLIEPAGSAAGHMTFGMSSEGGGDSASGRVAVFN